MTGHSQQLGEGYALAMKGQVSARKIHVVVQVAQGAGMDRARLLSDCGLNPSDLSDPERWLPQSLWKALWEAVIAHTGDPALALKAAAAIDPGYFGVIDYVARSAPTLAAAIDSAARYFRLANTQGHLVVAPHPDGLRVSRHISGDEGLLLPRQAAEFALATMLRVFRSACAQDFSLTQVCFRYPPPQDLAPFTNTFGCPVQFSATHDGLIVGHATLALPMKAPDARLHTMVARHGEMLLERLPQDPNTVLTQVRALLAEDLRGGDPSIDPVARRLGLSRRSLQRALREEGTTFTATREQMRRELACSYLDDGVSVGEVAFLLGYAEVPPFHRAFRRWTGHTPGRWPALAPAVKEEARGVKVQEAAQP